MDTKRLQAHRNTGIDQIQVKLGVTTTSVNSTTFSASGTFDRAFEAAPLVIGSNVEGGPVPVRVAVTTTGITVYLRGGSPTTLSDGTTYVTVTLEGRVA